MNLYLPTAAGRRRRAERAAARIPDPVERLQFLKALAARRRSRGLALRWFVVFALSCLILFPSITLHKTVSAAPEIVPHIIDAPAARNVWLVEKAGDSETWSNGLRIDNRFLVRTHARSYLAFPVGGDEPVRRAEPAGIVFHTTESSQAPFEESENGTLKRIGESMLEYVRRREAYNFVVDRFGRVFRVVGEEETANHAGYSAWADADWFYINLNESFIGVSFEGDSPGELTSAQVNSAAVLIGMLRYRYGIPASNCVTHAQVSVNPSNMLAGLHVDWASGFPFAALGLPDNYEVPAPAVWGLGFDYDAHFTDRASEPLRAGIEDARTILARDAAAAGVSSHAYQAGLRKRYRAMLAAVGRFDYHKR